MSKHVIDWLNAYLDGELNGSQLQQVEAHLVECQACRAELESLAALSSLLHEVPLPEFTPPERFAAQVSLRLPHRRPSAPANKAMGIGWSIIPAGLAALWIFGIASSWVNQILTVANNLGLLSGLSNWLVFQPGGSTSWATTLGQFGLLSGNTLDWAVLTEALGRTSLPQITIQVAIACLYLAWLAIWWVRRQRQGQDRLLEAEAGSRSA